MMIEVFLREITLLQHASDMYRLLKSSYIDYISSVSSSITERYISILM